MSPQDTLGGIAHVGIALGLHRSTMALACLATLPAAAVPLQVTVENIRSGQGQVAVCVFAGPRRFPDCAAGQRIATALQPARPGPMRFDFDLPPTTMAVAVVHDENANGTLDTNFIGIPREGVGVSNNPAPRRGPPTYAESAFTLSEAGGAIAIRMLYP
jgi:uncharacterized protein (DUF2141 family)